jgi:hypothetical protein
MIRATKENLGRAQIGTDGTVLMADGKAWVGGFPAPEPKTGLEVMTNWRFKVADSDANDGKGYWINPEGETYKNPIVAFRVLNMTGRVCQEPKPYISGYEDQLTRELLLFQNPYDLKGVSVMSIIYVDQSKLPDSWGYVPVLRRVQRFSSGQRYDSVDGSDVRAGDANSFSDPLGLWEFKLIDRKPMLSVVTGGDEQAGAVPMNQTVPLLLGKYPQGARLELRDTYVVEAIPKDPSHIYSKKILFIDAATWQSWAGQFYDRQGAMWTAPSFWFRRRETECGNYAALTLVLFRNYQTGSSVIYHVPFDIRNPTDSSLINPGMFTMKYLVSRGR